MATTTAQTGSTGTEIPIQKRLRTPEGDDKTVGKFSTNFEFMELLRKTPATNLRPKDGKIFIATRKDKIADVWKGLMNHNFLSVPVLQQKGNKYYGFLDLLDIVKFVVEHFGSAKLKLEKDFWLLTKKEEYFQNRTVNDAMIYPLSKRNPFHPITKGYSLLFVAELLAREPTLHRIPILDENGRMAGLITQTALVKYFYENIGQLGSIKSKPINQFHNLPAKVIVCKPTDTAIDAFNMMTTSDVSGIGVVNPDGVLVDNMSIKDLKVISTDTSLFWRLYQDVETFLSKLKTEMPNRPKNVVCVTPTDTMETVLRFFAETGIHRIYVVDSHKKPISVVTLKDIILQIIEN